MKKAPLNISVKVDVHVDSYNPKASPFAYDAESDAVAIGEALIGQASIRSANFKPGLAGWEMSKDGHCSVLRKEDRPVAARIGIW